RQIDDRLSRHDCQRQARIDQRLTKLSFRTVVIVEVGRIGVHRKKTEPCVVNSQDGPAQWMLINIAHFEIFVESSVPALFDCHEKPPILFLKPSRTRSCGHAREDGGGLPGPTAANAVSMCSD